MRAFGRSARTRGGFKATIGGARAVLTNRDYVGYLLTFCFAFTALFAYISTSPFVIQNVTGMSTSSYALVLFACFQGSLGLVFSNATALALEEAGCARRHRLGVPGLFAVHPGAVISPLVGVLGEDTAVPMSLAMVVALVLAVIAFGVLPRKSSASQGSTDLDQEPATTAPTRG